MNLLRIVWYMARKHSLQMAWKRFKMGLVGYTRLRCDCGRWKGRTCSVTCERCVLDPFLKAVQELRSQTS